MTFDRFAVHYVDFPFSDRPLQKGRPALVLSGSDFARTTGNVTVAMITSAKHSSWPGDCPIDDLGSVGLAHACKIRMRFTTIATPRIGRFQGRLAARDRAKVAAALRGFFAL